MGVRLEGNEIFSENSSNIPSEGIIKGSIQVPGDGNPIVLMADHPTIGGYPKIATVILNDISKLAHLSAGKEIRFQKVSLETAEKLYDENKKYLDKIFQLIKTI
jgi:allophanate hydrolase subunit 2